MQFTYAALAVLATTVLADTTVFMTEEVTITSCHPTVTDCPARSTVTSLTSYPVITGTAAPGPITETLDTTVVSTIFSCHPTVTDCPYGSVTTHIIPAVPTAPAVPAVPAAPANGTSYAVPAPSASKPVSVAVPVPTAPAVTSESSPELPVVTVTVSYCPAPEAPTTLVPAVPATSAPAVPEVPATGVPTTPTNTAAVPPFSQSGTGAPGAPANGTGVSTSTPPVYTGAASAVTGSVMAFAGLVAVLFI